MFDCEQSISPDLAGINEWKHTEHAEQSIITNRAFDSEGIEKMASFFTSYNTLYDTHFISSAESKNIVQKSLTLAD